jgi:hypothetical protein
MQRPNALTRCDNASAVDDDNGALVELWLEPAAQQGALTSAAELGMWTVLRINDTWGQLTASMR